MECKDCHAEMACRPRMDVTYYECPDCHGMWFNEGELEGMIKRRIAVDFGPSEPNAQPVGTNTICPVCGEGVRLVPMTTYATSKVKMLGCPVCFGRWLTRESGRDLIDIVCYSGPFGWLRKIGDGFRRQPRGSSGT